MPLSLPLEKRRGFLLAIRRKGRGFPLAILEGGGASLLPLEGSRVSSLPLRRARGFPLAIGKGADPFFAIVGRGVAFPFAIEEGAWLPCCHWRADLPFANGKGD